MEGASDLVEPAPGRLVAELLGNAAFDAGLPVPGEEFVEEWQLVGDAGATLSRILESKEAGDRFLSFLFHDGVKSRVVWLSETHHLACYGPNTVRDYGSLPDYLSACRINGGYHEVLFIVYHDTGRYDINLGSFVTRNLAPELADAVLQWLAWNTGVTRLCVSGRATRASPTPRGYECFVSNSQSPRELHSGEIVEVSVDVGRVLASRCNRNVTLLVILRAWEDGGASLAEAMRANQAPAKLKAYVILRDAPFLAPAIEATECVEDLSLHLYIQDESLYIQDEFAVAPANHGDLWDAIGRNRGIRSLCVFASYGLSCNEVKAYLRAAMSCATLRTIHAESLLFDLSDDEVRECLLLVATLLRSSPTVTQINFSDQIREAHGVLLAHIEQLLQLNRFRPVVAALDDSENEDGTARARLRKISALLESEKVLGHPGFMFHLIKANKNLLLHGKGAGGAAK
jgi:hypothetical protein